MKSEMKNLLLAVCVTLTAALPAAAQVRSEAQCREIALRQASAMKKADANPNVRLAATSRSFTSTAAEETYYVYNIGDNGFAIVSAGDENVPVLAYSETGSFPTDTTGMPANLLWWLKAQQEAAGAVATVSSPAPLATLAPRKSVEAVEVAPILGDIAWNQDAPFNSLCPDNSVTGCAATAMAMIMKHYNYPRIGKGNHAYVSPMMQYNLSYDFEAKPFEWSKMLSRYEAGSYTEEQGQAVAELMKACGVSIDMDYRTTVSSANALKAPDALVKYFKYNDNILFRIRSAYTNDEWKQMINEELTAGRPVLYNGSSKEIGHEFVIDGADGEGLYHVNWGWAGICDGYFDISLLDPQNPGIGGGTSAGGGYTRNQGMVIRIKPEKDTAEEHSHNWYMNGMVLLNELDNKGSIAATEQIGVGAYTFANYGPEFNGEGALALCKELDGEPVAVFGTKPFTQVAPSYGGNLQFSGAIPQDIEEGMYYLCIVSKSYKGTRWERVRGYQGYDSYIRTSFRNGRLTFYNSRKTPTLAGDLEISENLQINSYGKFTVTAKNNGTDFYYGYVGVMITPEAGSDKYAMYYDEMYLDPGEEKTIELDRALVNNDNFYLQEGESQICGIFTYGNSVYPLTQFWPVEIGFKEAPKLKLTQELTCQEVFKSGEEFVIPFSVDCEGDYKYNLVAGIFPWGTYQTTTILSTPLDMKEGDHVDSEIRGYFNPPLSEGKYLVALLAYDMKTGQYDSELGFTYFEVKGKSAIDGIEAEEELAPMYFNLQGQPVANPHPGDILIRVDRHGSRKVVF